MRGHGDARQVCNNIVVIMVLAKFSAGDSVQPLRG